MFKLVAPQGFYRGSPLRASNEGFLFSSLHHHTFSPGESPDCPSLRASSDHRFIVGALRARRTVWRLPLPFSGRAFREHRTSMGALCLSFSSCAFCEQEGPWPLLPHPSQAALCPLMPLSNSLVIPFTGGWPAWSPTARNFLTRPSTGTPRSAISPGEGLRRPRVARAQKIIRLHHSPVPRAGGRPGCPLSFFYFRRPMASEKLKAMRSQ